MIQFISKISIKVWLILFIVLLLLFSFILIKKNKELKETSIRRENTILNLNQDIKKFQINDSLNVAEITKVELSRDEFKKINKEQSKLISDLKLKLKNIEQVGTVVIHSIDTIHSIIYSDSIGIQKFNYKDQWIDIKGKIEHNDLTLSYDKKDSINIIESIVQKKFLFFHYGVKSRKVDILSQDPNTRVSVLKWITVIKK